MNPPARYLSLLTKYLSLVNRARLWTAIIGNKSQNSSSNKNGRPKAAATIGKADRECRLALRCLLELPGRIQHQPVVVLFTLHDIDLVDEILHVECPGLVDAVGQLQEMTLVVGTAAGEV